MGKEIDWVRQEPTGRLIYRRRYPADVQRVLGKLELKVPLGSKWRMTEAASRTYYRTCERFDREVRGARAAARIEAKKAAAAFDRLTPEQIDYLGGVLIHDRRTGLDQRLRQGHGGLLNEALALLLPELRKLRASGNTALMEEAIGPTADDLLASEGIWLDPADKEGRAAFIWALSGRIVAEGDNFIQSTEGYAPPIPPRPERPANPRGGKRTVAALIKAYKAAKWDGWSQSSRTAVEPAFRALQDAVGDKLVTDIDRDGARDVFELVKALPAALGKNKDLKHLPVPEAVKRGKELGLPTIGPKTVNGSYMAHISAAFGWAEDERWIPWNPFKRLSAADPVADEDKRDAFTDEQLKMLFSSAPWDRRQDHAASKPGRYWVPLIALYTGMRLGEIAGLRIMDAEKVDGVPSLRVRPYEGRSIKNKESRRDVPIPSALRRLGLLAFIQHRRDSAAPTDLLFPDGKANVRRQWGAELGEWFVGHLKEKKIIGTKLGMHSFRHSFEDRLRAAGGSGSAEALAVSGRSVAGSQSIYRTIDATGRGFPMANLEKLLEQVAYPGLDLSHLDGTETIRTCGHSAIPRPS